MSSNSDDEDNDENDGDSASDEGDSSSSDEEGNHNSDDKRRGSVSVFPMIFLKNNDDLSTSTSIRIIIKN